MSIARPCPYSDDWEHCKYEKYYGQPTLAKCSSCDRCKKEVKSIYKISLRKSDDKNRNR